MRDGAVRWRGAPVQLRSPYALPLRRRAKIPIFSLTIPHLFRYNSFIDMKRRRWEKDMGPPAPESRCSVRTGVGPHVDTGPGAAALNQLQ